MPTLRAFGMVHTLGGIRPFPRLRIFPAGPVAKAPAGRPADWVTPSGNPKDGWRDHEGIVNLTAWPVKDLVDLAALSKPHAFWQDARLAVIVELFNRFVSGTIKLQQFANTVLPFLADDFVHLQEAVILGIGNLSDMSTLTALATGPMKGAVDKRIRRGIAEGIGLTRSAEVIPLLAEALKDGDPDVRLEAVRGLSRSGSETAVPDLLEAMTDSNAAVKAAAIDGLAALKSTDSAPFIAKHAIGGDGLVRAAALEALGKLDPQAYMELLTKGLKDPDTRAKIGAMRGLYATGNPIAVEDISALLKSPDWRVRRVAIRSLWLFGEIVGASRRPGYVGIRPLITALTGAKGILRIEIHDALTDMLGRDLGMDPKAWSDWWDINRERWVIPPMGTALEVALPTGGTIAAPKPFSLELSDDVAFIVDLSGGWDSAGLASALNGIAEAVKLMPRGSRFKVVAWRFPSGQSKGHSETPVGLQVSTPPNDGTRQQLLRLAAKGWSELGAPLLLSLHDKDVKIVAYFTEGGVNRGIGGAEEPLNHIGLNGSQATDRLVEWIKRENRYEVKTVNVVTIGKGAEFGKKVAAAGRGDAVQIWR